MFAPVRRHLREGFDFVWVKLYGKLPDLDDVFAYDTVREVCVLDRRLGIVNRVVVLMVVCYIVVYVMMIEKKYLEEEKSMGFVLTDVQRPVYDVAGLPFDIFESNTNPGEADATFVPTRIVVTKGQIGDGQYCGSPLHPCTTHADCDIGDARLQRPECVAGMCQRQQWCPAENPSDSKISAVHTLQFEDAQLWFQSSVHFHKFRINVGTTEEKKPILYPKKGANTFSVKDLLRMASLKPEDVVNNGAILILNVIFECDLDNKDCDVSFKAINVDSKVGFNHVHTHNYLENGQRKRDMYRMYGIRVAAFATGVGRRTSFSEIVLQFSSALALLSVARTAADFVLQYLVPERNHYMAQKVLHTEDFNEDI